MIKRLFISVLLVCSSLTACGGKVELLKDISEVEANEVLAALLEAGIRAEKLPGKEGMVSLSVEEAQFSRAIALLTAEGLPHEKYAKMGDVFRKEGMISSPLEERARYLWALSQELSATVSQIDGVIKARVHVVLPERSNGSDPSMPSSAAVFIKHKPGFNFDDVIPQVKRLVSNSIPGLVQEKVTVVMLPSMSRTDTDEKLSTNGSTPARASVTDAANPTSDRKQFREGAGVIWGVCAGLLALLAAAAVSIWKKWGGREQLIPAISPSAKGAGGTTKEPDAGSAPAPAADDQG
jgi:type III secretion protein J